MVRYKYTDEQLAEVVRKSGSYRQVLRTLGMYDQGGNYVILKRRIFAAGISNSHFIGHRHGTSIRKNEIPVEKLLCLGTSISSSSLKKKLIKAKKFKYECSECYIKEWRGKYIALHLEHKNGINNDNRIENLCLLCPNCHSQTESYCRGTRRRATKECVDCGKKISVRYDRCHKCAGAKCRDALFKISWPPPNSLAAEVKNKGYRATGLRLGVSDNAVKKHLKFYGVVIRKHKPRMSSKIALIAQLVEQRTENPRVGCSIQPQCTN